MPFMIIWQRFTRAEFQFVYLWSHLEYCRLLFRRAVFDFFILTHITHLKKF